MTLLRGGLSLKGNRNNQFGCARGGPLRLLNVVGEIQISPLPRLIAIRNHSKSPPGKLDSERIDPEQNVAMSSTKAVTADLANNALCIGD